MKLKTMHWAGIGIGVFMLVLNFIIFLRMRIFYFVLGISIVVAVLPFLASVMIESGRQKEKEMMFLEFSRNLVESVKSGTPISKSIINVRNKDYGSLTPHVDKLANQISLGIPVKQAFDIFARDTENKVITRSVSLIREAEESGGKIDEILENVAKSVGEVEDTRKEQKSAMYNTVVQLYIIFVIFLVIMLVMQIKFIPMITKTMSTASGGLGAGSPFSFGGGAGAQEGSIEVINKMFLGLIIVQGFFAGLVIGKLSEGNVKSGLKHSAILVALAYLITSGVKAFSA